MDRELDVFMDIVGCPTPVGRLWVRDRHRRETATFVYDQNWIRGSGSFPLAPPLHLGPGAFQSADGIFSAFKDPAPDRWGQKLMRHHERERARETGTQPQTLLAADFLVGVNDDTRLGALRFKNAGSEEFLSRSEYAVPPLIELRHLLSATDRLERGRERHGDLALVLGPGGSLGGARPKATVRDRDGRLHVAKFPWAQDEWSVIRWEAVTLNLAQSAGISVPEWRIEPIARRAVLLIARFDRVDANVRVPFMSAMTALDARDHEDRSYLELVDALRQMGEAPEQDIRELWRRMVFNVLVSNTDDHLRNHALLRGQRGWRLSPAYDMNPSPADVGGRIHSLALNEDERTASLEVALSVAAYFGLSANEAREIAAEVARATSRWKDTADQHGIERHEVDRMSSAFDHGDLNAALSLAQPVAGPNERKKPKAKKRSKATETVKKTGR